METVRQSILVNDWAVSIDLTDSCLHVPIHPQSKKYLQFMFEDQAFEFTALLFRMFLSPWIFTKLMDVIAAHLRQCAILLFPYLDDWLIRDLICNRLVSHTIYCLQTVQSLGFIPNLKKSDLIPAQKFTFIGMEFLTQQNIVRVPAGRIDFLLLSIKIILSQAQVSAQTFFSFLGKLSAAADVILLDRFHLRPLQMCLLSVWRPHILPLDHQVPINSTDRPLKTEWALDQSVVNSVFQMLNYPNVDLFATRFNHKLPLHVSPVLDNHALACIINELESSSCICICTNNSDTLCSSQDMSISVQNSSY